ncbi:MAG: phosphomannomutase/phosphoglucomutase [Phototrophicaceae bacterium]
MQVAPEIFKAYDIRGIYGENLFEETAEVVARCFTKVVGASTVVVGRDARVSSPSLHAEVLKGLTAVGVNVIDLGMVSTDMYYYACAEKGLPGMMITASHNPKEYNGFKMVRKVPHLLSGDEGIQDIRQMIENDQVPEDADSAGSIEQWDVMDEFVAKMLTLVDASEFKPYTVLADTANGMVGPSLEKLFEHIPQVKLVPMYFEPDGTFPNHGGDPLQEENRAEIQQRVPAEGADLGFLFDPDGDRFFVIDGRGRFIAGDFMTAILAKYFLEKEGSGTIVYDIRSSLAVKDTVEAHNGKALYNRVGHAFIKKRMMEEDAVFGGEVTGHYYFRDFYFSDSGVVPMLYLMDLLSHSDKTMAELIDDYEANYNLAGEINTRGVVAKDVMERLQNIYGESANEVLTVDGLTFEFDTWRFNVRASNTEPLVRLNLEADSVALMEEKRDEVLAVIREGLS